MLYSPIVLLADCTSEDLLSFQQVAKVDVQRRQLVFFQSMNLLSIIQLRLVRLISVCFGCSWCRRERDIFRIAAMITARKVQFVCLSARASLPRSKRARLTFPRTPGSSPSPSLPSNPSRVEYRPPSTVSSDANPFLAAHRRLPLHLTPKGQLLALVEELEVEMRSETRVRLGMTSLAKKKEGKDGVGTS